MAVLTEIPLSLYLHLPWCVQKCPYCDFNSHAVKAGIPEKAYVNTILEDLDENLRKDETLSTRPLLSLFFGGGTPSLFSASAIEAILEGVQKRLQLTSTTEITLEANPGTLEQGRFQAYRRLGINRLSIGIQSLDDKKLKLLGRIHGRETAIRAIKTAQDAGFENLNLDLMYGLPTQSKSEALKDLEEALSFKSSHFSWYQLTIEPNTAFYHSRPSLPPDEELWELQTEGQALLQTQQFKQYEVSAYCRPGYECQHNLNYWQFGDYLGVGAGAHSKITDLKEQKVRRHWQVKNPRDYLDPLKPKTAEQLEVSRAELVFEFMLNALRLNEGVPLSLFEERTGLDSTLIEPQLSLARTKKLLIPDQQVLKPSDLGKQFLNDLTALFLP